MPAKIILANNFFKFTIFSFFLSVFYFSTILIITERPLSFNYDKSLDEWEENIWYVIITMTTIGYGDRTAKTLTSRLVVMIIVIWGNFWTSMMLGALIPYI